MCKCCNNLLYALSARQELSWFTFKELIEGFYPQIALEHPNLSGVEELRRQVVRTLDLLAHCEFSFSDENRVYTSPPVLALLPKAGLPRAILCGARGPTTFRDLQRAGASANPKMSIECQPLSRDNMCAPDRICVSAGSFESLRVLSTRMGFEFSDVPPAWTIVHFAGSLETYLSSRAWSEGLSLNWRRWDFDLSTLSFTSQHVDSPILCRYEDPVRLVPRYYLKHGNQWAQVDLDWGRYAALNLAHMNVLIYDEARELLAVPRGASLPRLYARVLGLSSGRAPQIINGKLPASFGMAELSSFYLYSEVPPAIATELAKKLGQPLTGSAIEL